MNILIKNSKYFLKIKYFLVLIPGLVMILLIGVNYVFAGEYSQGNNIFKQHNLKHPIKAEKNRRTIITLEFYGGYSFLNPSDLNTAAQYHEKYYDWYYGEQYQYYSSIYSDYFHFSESKEGKFQKIKNAFPFGLRIKIHATSRLAFSLGFQYLNREETSDISLHYDVYSAIPDISHFFDDYTQTIKLSPLSISVKGHILLLGIHYRIPLSQSLSLETFLSGGPLFVQSQLLRTVIQTKTDNYYDFWEEYTTKNDYKGNGSGYSFETGIRAEWLAVRDIGLFVECGYSFQKAGKIHGQTSYNYCIESSNAPKICEPAESWKGYWGFYSIDIQKNYIFQWGDFSGKQLVTYYDEKNSAVNDFHLDFSGFQLRIGLSFHFR